MKVPGFLRVLKPAMPRFKASAVLLLAIVWCIAVCWIWLWGADWQIGQQKPLASLLSRWLVTTFLVLLALGWITLRILRRLHYLERQQARAREELKDPLSADIARQRRYLQHWLVQLHRHINRRQYQYQLPWYLIIGSRNSGKSTLLQKSMKLSPLFDADKLKPNSDHNIHVHCAVGKQAVVLDVDGELIEQRFNSDDTQPELLSRLWQDLLQWLVETRPRQPLNGIVLTVDTGQFMTFNKAQQDAWLVTIRQRLQDVYQHLHAQLPIYIVLTHLDQLYGFDCMYQSLDNTQREAMLGVTFTAPSTSWKEELDTFWQNWMEQVNQAMPGMMLKIVNGSQRSPLFSFSRQIYGLHEYVVQLIEGILFNDAHSPLIRGVYLTSSLQRGQMDDLFVQTAATQYHLNLGIFPAWPAGDSKPYFTRALFNQLLFSEPNIASENRYWLAQARRKMMWCAALFSVAAVALLYGWHRYYRINYQAGVDVLAQTRNFLKIPPPKRIDYDGNLQLPLLNPLHEATLAYGNYRDRNTLLADMGLYQGGKIGPYVEETYLKLLQQRYLPALMRGLIQQLKQAPPGSEARLNILRIIRMLDDKSGRNDALVKQYMAARWSERFTGQKNLQTQLMTHLEYALAHTDWHGLREQGNQQALQDFAPFAQTIRDTQKELSKLSIYQRVYQSLRAKAQQVLPSDLNLRDQIGANFDNVFTARDENLLRIPQFLTRDGLKNYFIKQRDSLVELTAMDSWVLNLTQNVKYSDADRQEIQRHITEQYQGDYTATWRTAMSNIDIQAFGDLQQLIAALEQVINGDQVFRRALQVLRDNTQEPTLPDGVTDKQQQTILDSPVYRLQAQISRDFIQENSLLAENKDGSRSIQGIYQTLTDLHRYLLAIQNAPAPGKSALKAVQLRIKENANDPIFSTQQMAKNLPEPLNRWVAGLAEQAWRMVMLEAIQYLEIEWANTVVKPWKSYLAGRYPFKSSAKEDAALSEFERFFKADGTLDTFYKQNLKPFVENDLTWGSDNQTLIRSDIREQLAIAQKIRDTFFNAQNNLETQYAVETVALSPDKIRSVLNMDGQLLEYTHGRSRSVKLIWPNSMRNSTISKLTLVPGAPNKAPRSITFSGPWAQLRLINSGQLTDVRDGSFNVRFAIDGGYVTYRIRVDASDNPFAGSLFSKFSLPETLY